MCACKIKEKKRGEKKRKKRRKKKKRERGKKKCVPKTRQKQFDGQEGKHKENESTAHQTCFLFAVLPSFVSLHIPMLPYIYPPSLPPYLPPRPPCKPPRRRPLRRVPSLPS